MATRKTHSLSLRGDVQPYINEISKINDQFSGMTLNTPEEKQSVIDLLLNVLSKYQDGSTTTTRIDSINGFEQKTNEICSTLADILSNGEDYLDTNGNINIEHARLKPIIDILDNDSGDVKEFINNLNKSGYIKNASKEFKNLLAIEEQKTDLVVTKKNGGSDPLLKKYNGGENTFFDNFNRSNGGHHFFMGVGQNHKFADQSQGLLMFFFNIGDDENKINIKEFNDNQMSFVNLKINGSLYLIKKVTTKTDNTATSTTSEFVIGPFDADLELNMATHKISNLNCTDFNLDFFKLFCGQQDYFETGKLDDIDDPCYCFRDNLKQKIGDKLIVGDVIKNRYNIFKITNVNGDEYTVVETNESGTDDKIIDKIINKTKLREYNKVNAAPAADTTVNAAPAQDTTVNAAITSTESVISSIPLSVSSTNPPCYDDTKYIKDNKNTFDKIDKKLSKFSEIYDKNFNINDDFISKPTDIISAIQQELDNNETTLLSDLTRHYTWEIIDDKKISDQISSNNVFIKNINLNSNDSSYKFFKDSCQIKYLGNKKFLVVPRIFKNPSTDHSVLVHYPYKSGLKIQSSSLVYLNNTVVLSEKKQNMIQTATDNVPNITHTVSKITYKEVDIVTSGNEPFNASFYETGINEFYIKDKDVVMNARTQIQERFPYDPNRNENTMIGSLIFLGLCFAFYTKFVSPLLLWLYDYVSKVALVGTAIKLFNNQDLLNIITGNVNLNEAIASTSNFAITMIMSLISFSLMIIPLIISGSGNALNFSIKSFKFINKTYAEGIARLTIYYLAPALSTNNQYNRLLQDSFQKNPNMFLENKTKGLNAQQMLTVKSSENNSVSDKVNLFLKSDLWSINLWKIVLYVLSITVVVFVHDKKRGGKLSRKTKNNKKTKKPNFLKRAKKTLRRGKISGGGKTDNIENMKNLTGITYFLLSAFSGYYTSLSSIQVPKFMYNAVKVFLKL
jgi:hypothetical protein